MTASAHATSTRGNAVSWAQRAACKGLPLDAFFTDSVTGVAAAKRVCGGCPVRTVCLAEALNAEDGSRYGIFGGLTPDERTELAGSRKRRAPVKRTGGKAPAPCGTRGAYDRHRRNDEPIDDACAKAYARWRQEQRDKAACGTRSGYRRHRKNGESACEACRIANAQADRRLRTTGSTKART